MINNEKAVELLQHIVRMRTENDNEVEVAVYLQILLNRYRLVWY